MSACTWEKTKNALQVLKKFLKCAACGGLLRDPCSISSCDHSFCRVCATGAINAKSKCPVCGSFAWLKDLQANRQLANTVEFCNKLQNMIHLISEGCCTNLDSVHTAACNEMSMSNETHENKIKNSSLVEKTGDHGVDTLPGQNSQLEIVTTANDVELNGEDEFPEADLDIHRTNKANNAASKVGNQEEFANEDVCIDNSDETKQETRDDEMVENPSWPLSSPKPKKIMKTYSKMDKNWNVKQGFQCIAKQSSSVSDSDSIYPSGKVSKNCLKHVQLLGARNEFTSVDDELNSFDYNEGRVSEDTSFPNESDAKQTNHVDYQTNKSAVQAGPKKHITRLRRKRNENIDGETGNIPENAKGSKRSYSGPAVVCMKTADKKSIVDPTASVMKRNKKGETPLHVAAIKGKYDTAQQLLENGADPNSKDFAGWTPLHEACNHGRFEIVQLLLDFGAFIDIPGCDHDTPLHDAIANSRFEVAEFLVSKGASLNVRNKYGLLPMDYIRSNTAKEQLLMAASIAQENKETKMTEVSSNLVRKLLAKPKKILHTSLDPKEVKCLEKCAKNLGAKIVDRFDEEVTHIVSSMDENGKCNRTLKYLLGLLTGKWILSNQWVTKSLLLKSWANEEEFEIKGSSDASDGMPRKARLNATKQFPGLFDGCSFYFSGEFTSTPSKEELLQIIRLGGGSILLREPKIETSHPLITPASPAVMKMMSSKTDERPSVAYHAKPDTAQSYCTQYILFDKECSPDHKRISTPIMCTAPTTWLLDCISRFEILEVKDI